MHAPSGTAVISDLHLGCRGGRDLLSSNENRALLLRGIAHAERVVLLGDTVELLERPMSAALEAARPFFEALGRGMEGRTVVLVPGEP
jgi:UDP-2,3-diacylglucosamine pyrophosphatase LpxH